MIRSLARAGVKCRAIHGVVARATTLIGSTSMVYANPTRGASSANVRRSDGSANFPVKKMKWGMAARRRMRDEKPGRGASDSSFLPHPSSFLCLGVFQLVTTSEPPECRRQDAEPQNRAHYG